jgi:hypothetical protein
MRPAVAFIVPEPPGFTDAITPPTQAVMAQTTADTVGYGEGMCCCCAAMNIRTAA